MKNEMGKKRESQPNELWKKRARETTPIYGFIAFCCNRKYFHWFYTITSGLTLLIIAIFSFSMLNEKPLSIFLSLFRFLWIWIFFQHFYLFIGLWFGGFSIWFSRVVWWFQWKPFIHRIEMTHTHTHQPTNTHKEQQKKMWLITFFCAFIFLLIISLLWWKSAPYIH